jgi:hypothetical protein
MSLMRSGKVVWNRLSGSKKGCHECILWYAIEALRMLVFDVGAECRYLR